MSQVVQPVRVGGHRRRSVLAAAAARVESLIPRRYHLGFELFRHRIRGRVEDELLGLDRLIEGRKLAVDVGANRGYYTYAMARLFDRVVSFEANERTLGLLRAARLPNVSIYPVGLSAEQGSMELYVPAVRGVVHEGWASFNPHNLPEATEVERLEVAVRTLDSFAFDDVSFIKIDVEGHELAVLEGAAETIARCRPVVLSEVKEATRSAVLGFFDARGYAAYQFREGQLRPCSTAEAIDSQHDNFVFRPVGGFAQ